MYTLTTTLAATTVAQFHFVPKSDRAMVAFVSLFGSKGIVDLYEGPGSEEHDGAWNCFGVLENHTKLMEV